jgi:hypothetical protein
MGEVERLLARNLELTIELEQLRKQRHQAPGLEHPDFRRKMRDRVAIAILSAWESHDPIESAKQPDARIEHAMDYAELFIEHSEIRYGQDRAAAERRRVTGARGAQVDAGVPAVPPPAT